LGEQERVWERFYRVPNSEVQHTSSSPHVGLGVGLYICRSIIERHQGQAGVESRVGDGSTFWFSLPICEQRRDNAVAVI
jgi:signal transduction histidine kinase